MMAVFTGVRGVNPLRGVVFMAAVLATQGVAVAVDPPKPAAWRPVAPDAAAWAKLAPHPRLFVDAARLTVLRAADDSATRDLVRLVRREADKAVDAPPIDYTDGPSFMMFAMRAAQGRILSCALAYRLTDERRYFDAARRELLILAGLPDWCPRHFLDVGEAALACGVGLDWLYDDLSADDRDRIARAIVDNALKPSLDVPAGGTSWVSGDFNWNPVCHAGLSTGALAIAEREPALAKRIVERAVANLPHAAASYAPDGAFPEGPSYWAYGTTFYVLMVEALRTSLHTDGGLAAAPGFLKSVDFLKQITTPTGREFDYADYHTRRPPEPVRLWFARELRRRDIADGELADVRKLAAADPGPEDQSAPSDGTRHLAFGLLWWDPALPPAAAEPLPRRWVADGVAPLAVFRSAWDDPRATYVALKGGTSNGSHAHMDVGGFILEADGVRWAVDLGTENYVRMRAAKIDLWNYTQDSTRWTVFRNGPDGHNVLRFDGGRPLSLGVAKVRPMPDAADGTWAAVADLTPLYRERAKEVTRVVRLHPDRSVSLTDSWSAGEAATDVTWQWLTRAAVEITPTGATLREAGETLRLRIDGPPGKSIEVQDVSRPTGPADSPNSGLSRIVVRVRTAAHARATLTVHAVPGRP